MSNPCIIELLEVYLQAARDGKFDHAAVAMTGYDGIAAFDFAGDIRLEPTTVRAIALLNDKLKNSIDTWTLPPQDKNLDQSNVVYNLGCGPLGFDFIVWLLHAEMMRRKANVPPPLKVAFWTANSDPRLSARGRQQWVDNVFRPSLALIGAVEDEAALRGYRPEVYVTRPLVDAAKRGVTIPRLRSLLKAPVIEKRYITITLREASHNPERNSSLGAWLSFAKYLEKHGEHVIFVRDFERADDPLEGFRTEPRASSHLLARMALYENAAVNLFVSNGPGILCVFGSRPWLQFVRDVDGTPEFWRDKIGLCVGEQYPWSAPNQRVIWAPDTYDNIVAAWEQHIGSIEAAA